jgi:hypothetical protein
MAHERWAEQQIRAAVACGISLANAQAAAKWVLDHLPPDADPTTYIFSAEQLGQNITTEAIEMDARRDWYERENVPSTFKRILDARLNDA